MGKENLYHQLIEYSKGRAYPFHMPGHKRRMMAMEDPYRFDLTEIDGFDNLHDAGDILKWEQDRAAGLYGSEETHFMVNGSTGGILSAIAGVVHRGDRVLVARNCHKSVYHALEMNGLRPVYVWPEPDVDSGIYKGLTREAVESCLGKYSDVRAVIFTSPTYEGLLSDVKGICEAAHARDIPCIVDEAHGAHLRWIGIKDAVSCGADVVIQSLHKTMPALTQTALIHINGPLVSRERIRKMLSSYQTSSPSYVLMASISLCMEWLETEGKKDFQCYADQMHLFRERMTKLRYLYIYSEDREFDWGKLVISTLRAPINGRQLYDLLRDEYQLQAEMVSAEYVLAMSTVGDSEEGLNRLAEALEKIDVMLDSMIQCQTEAGRTDGISRVCPEKISRPERRMEIDAACASDTEMISLDRAAGRTAGDYLYLYPPGIPILVPGEVMDAKQIEQIQYFLSQGLDVHGGYIKESGDVKVILHHGEECFR